MHKNILVSAYAFYPSVGGLEEQSYLLSQEWIKLGHSVDVLTEKMYPDQLSHEIVNGISIYRIPFVAKRTAFDHIKIIFFLSKYILENRAKYDFCMLRAAITLYPLIFGFWKVLRVIGYKTYVTADTGGDKDEITLIKKIPLYRLLFPVYSAHDYYNSICADNVVHFQNISIPKNKLTRIPNGIEFKIKSHASPKSIERFLFLGRLQLYKGVRDLLAAFKKYQHYNRQATLTIGGIGPEESFIRKYISDNRLTKSVRLYGLVDSNDKDHFFSLGDCLVLPSYSEGFGLVILEAMQRKKVVIATDVADLREQFGEKIHFCKKKNPEDLFSVMSSLKKSFSPDDADYKDLLSQYNISYIAKQILKLS